MESKSKANSRQRNGTAKRKKKLKPRLVPGTWVGVTERSKEHKIITHSGRAIRVRTTQRKPIEDRWSKERIMEIRATPRMPNPSDPTDEEVDPRTLVEDIAELDRAPDLEARVPEVERVETRPPRDRDIRDLRLTKRLLGNF